jgi:histidinol-phosphate aminotransferase
MTRPDNIGTTMGRRSFFWAAGLAVAGPIVTEASLAYARLSALGANVPPDAVLINANENPLGPCKAALDAIAQIAPLGGRYDRWDDTDKLIKTFADLHGVGADYVSIYAGSGEPLHFTVLAFTSAAHGLVVADPSYEAPVAAAAVSGAAVHKVPLASDYAHDVKAMVAADPSAGVLYICNPNNPTGTVTPREDIVWALANKPASAILLVDEAYIHLSDEPSVIDMVAQGKDLIVLRTFSKVYGMAGIRCGVAIGRPDLLAKLQAYYQNPMPVTALAAARASLADADLVPTRKKWIGDTRTGTISWLTAHGYRVVGQPRSNCFMIDTGRDGRSVITALRNHKVYIGRIWPIWPRAVRVTVGTPEDMEKFRTAFKSVMDGSSNLAGVSDMRHGSAERRIPS